MNDGQMIPRKIHYCWFGGGEPGKKDKKYIEGWSRACPGFEIIRWDESNYDINKNRFMKEAANAGKWSFVSDFARLDILYEHGGIYFDTDVEIIKDFSDLLKYEGFIGFENDEKVNDGQGFGFRPGHPILQEMMKAYENEKFIKEDGTLNIKESPLYRTECLVKHGLKLNGERQNIEGIEIFPKDYFCPKDFYTRRVKLTDNTHSIHHFHESWHSKKARVLSGFRTVLCRMLGTERGLKTFTDIMEWKDRRK